MSGPSAAWLQPWPMSAGELGCWDRQPGIQLCLTYPADHCWGVGQGETVWRETFPGKVKPRLIWEAEQVSTGVGTALLAKRAALSKWPLVSHPASSASFSSPSNWGQSHLFFRVVGKIKCNYIKECILKGFSLVIETYATIFQKAPQRASGSGEGYGTCCEVPALGAPGLDGLQQPPPLLSPPYLCCLQYVWDRMLGGFKHKNFRTREGTCLCLVATLNA